MSRIILVTGWFDVYDRNGRKTGKKEFVVSHGINEDTFHNVILPCEHPSRLGGVFVEAIGEWVLEDK